MKSNMEAAYALILVTSEMQMQRDENKKLRIIHIYTHHNISKTT